jgi:hypothetical protein
MRYELRLADRAAEDLAAVPLSLLDEVERALRRLAASPTLLSFRSAVPHPPDRQLYYFWLHDYEGKRWDFTVHFRYGQDEQTLHVARVVFREPS